MALNCKLIELFLFRVVNMCLKGSDMSIIFWKNNVETHSSQCYKFFQLFFSYSYMYINRLFEMGTEFTYCSVLTFFTQLHIMTSCNTLPHCFWLDA